MFAYQHGHFVFCVTNPGEKLNLDQILVLLQRVVLTILICFAKVFMFLFSGLMLMVCELKIEARNWEVG